MTTLPTGGNPVITQEVLIQRIVKTDYGFTPRTKEIFQAVCEGLSTADMINKFGISDKGIKFHLTRIFRITKCRNRKELRAKLGLLSEIQ